MKRRSSSTKRKPAPKRSGSPNNFPEDVRLAVRRRSGGRCEARTTVCTDTAHAFHHRKGRGSKDQREVNCLHLCHECHRHIHANPTKSYLMGWLVHSYSDPADMPVRRGDGGR